MPGSVFVGERVPGEDHVGGLDVQFVEAPDVDAHLHGGGAHHALERPVEERLLDADVVVEPLQVNAGLIHAASRVGLC